MTTKPTNVAALVAALDDAVELLAAVVQATTATVNEAASETAALSRRFRIINAWRSVADDATPPRMLN